MSRARLPSASGEPRFSFSLASKCKTSALRRGAACCGRPTSNFLSTSANYPPRFPNRIPGPHRWVLIPCIALALVFSGCWKKRLSASEIHAVSKEFADAARSIAGKQSEIVVRPEIANLPGGQSYFADDQIFIILEDLNKQAAIETALDAVARRHHLTHGSETATNGGGARFEYSRGDQRTHIIHIFEHVAAAAPHPSNLPASAPRLAIIIDDLGHDLPPVREILQLPYPLTLSVIPGLPNSSEVANDAHSHGDEVLLHLPMQAIEADAKTEPVELRVGMNSNQVDQILSTMLESVPHAAGVNNHQGSRATADPALMNALMESLQHRGLFFVDSRTTKETVAYDTAEKDGVRAAFRNAQFLDDTPTQAAIVGQLNRAIADAKRKGWAVTIGHPHPATIAVLREQLPQIESKGIKLVFVSEVVK